MLPPSLALVPHPVSKLVRSIKESVHIRLSVQYQLTIRRILLLVLELERFYDY